MNAPADYTLSDESRREQLESLMRFVTIKLAFPIYILLWPVDIIWDPATKYQFLAIRLCGGFSSLAMGVFFRRSFKTLAQAETCSVLAIGMIAAFIGTLGFLSETRDVASHYFEGLNLCALATVPFLPLRRPALVAMLLAIYGPFLVLTLGEVFYPLHLRGFTMHLAIMISTVAIALALRVVTGRIRRNERVAEINLVLLARQVAHDIRSPLAALKAAVHGVEELPEANRTLIQSAVTRIDDIANDLLTRHPGIDATPDPLSDPPRTHWLAPLLGTLVSEKRLEFQSRSAAGIHFESAVAAYESFAWCKRGSLKRALSNLINNAFEALDGSPKGQIRVSLETRADKIIIGISDNGKGIAGEILEMLRSQALTHGKTGGHGLGLRQAREAVEACGGTLEIESDLSRGTRVTVSLQRGSTPEWFLDSLSLSRSAPVWVVDDEEFIHGMWKGRLESIGLDVKHCFSVGELNDLVRQRPQDAASATLLIDHGFRNGNETGLDAIKRLKFKKAVLVTNNYEHELVQKECLILGVKLLPKNVAHLIALKIDS